jgi:3-keto-5-aminohexanoate cleavage enzyme
MSDNSKKVIITVAPVSHPGKPVPAGCKNPLTPEEISNDVVNCAKAGAAMVHLHVRDLTGEQTFNLDVFRKTLDVFSAKSDIVIQGSTGGLVNFTLEERCVCLNEPRVEVASLNMGSVNFADSVYINTLPDMRYWAQRMIEARVIPEMELFDLSMNRNCSIMANEGLVARPMHYNYCLGSGAASAIPATPQNLMMMISAMEPGSHWGLNHDSMPDQSMLAAAIVMGARTVRVGFEDSFNYAPGKVAASNVQLVEHLADLILKLSYEIATPEEAREMLGITKIRG